jgi:transglutaminase-like putative cysteine protease
MHIRIGYTLAFNTFGPTPMNLLLSVHPERAADLVTPEVITFDPPVPARQFTDPFGNVCTRIVAPGRRISMLADFVIRDSGKPDPVVPDAVQHPVEDLPDDVLPFLLGSRYCDTDKLSNIAWSLFGNTPPGWARVQAIADFVHNHIRFDYQKADDTRTAFDGYTQREGVCRDYAHLAIALCRCMNIPARYCTGYLGDIGIPPVPYPMDFSAWFEVFLSGRWYTFDARHNTPRIGRIVMARGRDATDCALTTSFGRAPLTQFEVHTDEVKDLRSVSWARLAQAA